MALDRDIERLSRVPFFAALGRDALRLVAFAAEARTARPGDVLFRRGEAAEGALLVVTGRVALDRSGGGEAGGTSAGPGTLLSGRALLTACHHDATATAREASTILRVPRAALLRALAEYPADAARLRRHWARDLAARLARLRRAIRS